MFMKQLWLLGCSLLCGVWNVAYAQDGLVSNDTYVDVKKSAYDDTNGIKRDTSDEDNDDLVGDAGSGEDKRGAIVDWIPGHSIELPISFSHGSKGESGAETTFFQVSLGISPSFSWKLLLRDNFYINTGFGLGVSGKISDDTSSDRKSGVKVGGSVADRFMIGYGLDRRRSGFDVSFRKGYLFPVLDGNSLFGASTWIRQGIRRDDYALRHKCSLEGSYTGRDCPVALALKDGESSVSFALGIRGGYEFALEEGTHAGLLYEDVSKSGGDAKKFDRLRVGFYSLLRVLRVSCSAGSVAHGCSCESAGGMRTVPAVGGVLDVDYTPVKDVLCWKVLAMWLSGCSDYASSCGFPRIDAEKQNGIVGRVENPSQFIFRSCDVLALKSSLKYTLVSNVDATFKGGYLRSSFNVNDLGDYKGALVKSAYFAGMDLSYKFKHVVLGGGYYLGAKASFSNSAQSVHAYGLSLEIA